MNSFSQIQTKSSSGKISLETKDCVIEGSCDNQNVKRKRKETEFEKKETDTKILLRQIWKSKELKELNVSKLAFFSMFGITHMSPYQVLNDVIEVPCSYYSFAGSSFISSTGNLSNIINEKCKKGIAIRILKTKIQKWLIDIDTKLDVENSIQNIFTELDDNKIMTSQAQIQYEDFKKRIENNDSISNEEMREEFRWYSDSKLCKFALFRRLLQPIQRIMINNILEENNKIYYDPCHDTSEKSIIIENMDISLLDILLGVDYLHSILAKVLFMRLDQIQSEYEKCPKLLSNLRNLILDHFDRLHPKIDKWKQNEEFQECLFSFLSTIKEDKCTVYCKLSPWLTDDRQKELRNSRINESKDSFDVIETIPHQLQTTPTSVMDLPIETETLKEDKDNAVRSLKKAENNQWNKSKNRFWLNSLEPTLKKETLKIRAEVKTMYEEVEQSQRIRSDYVQKRHRSSRRVTLKNRAPDGSLVFDSHEISRNDFIQRTQFMNKVNEEFQRRFEPGRSRPTLKCLNIENLQEIRSIFFDDDGSLQNSIFNDIDISCKNDPRLISFGKMTASAIRNDRRWQVSIRKHGVGSFVPTRRKIEQIFHKSGDISPEFDEIHEMAILIGGTEDQRLHHDVARQIAIWYKEKPSVNNIEQEPPLTGWEVDRLQYNKAMESKFSPSSILLALNQNDEFLLGIQKDQVFLSPDGKFCQVIGGCNERLQIVRTNATVVVVIVPIGCIFTGDFPHCGVKNFEENSPEKEVLDELESKVKTLLQEIPARERILRSQKIIQTMCGLPGLMNLSRLHISTEPADGSFRQPSNAVGFSYCVMNERDGRCKMNDAKQVENENLHDEK